MRIGVLEWASSGGGSIGAWHMDVPRAGESELPAAIVEEGWAMTHAAIRSLMVAGHEVVAGLLPDLVSRVELPVSSNHSMTAIDVARPIKRQWQTLYGSCDATIVIAPESDGVLEELINWCHRRRIVTCNAQPQFIARATDKWLCALRWRECGLPHPATRCLDHVTPQWLELAASHARRYSTDEPLFVIKPRDGVGCEGIERLMQPDMLARVDKVTSAGTGLQWIVQPWLDGVACSRAAIVDRSGQKQWLPVARQNLAVGQRVAYRGGSIEPADWQDRPEITQQLEQAIDSLGDGAAGWIGVDFVYHPATSDITVIEVNPRLTTSFVELCRVVEPALAGKLAAGASRGQRQV